MRAESTIRAPLVWLLAAAPLAAAAAAAAQQPAVVAGRVVEAETNRRIESADVRLDDAARVTNADGLFRFDGVRPGRHTLVVSALGYRTAELELEVAGDTLLLVRLEVGPVTLDPLDVRSRFVDVRGRVSDATGDLSLRGAVVVSGSERTTAGNGGRYRLRRVPADVPGIVEAGAFGYLPATERITPENDVRLDFRLREDPVAGRMIDELIAKVEVRSRALPYSRRHVDRETLLRRRNFPVADLLKSELGPRIGRVQCVMIDDVEVAFGMEQLASYMPEDLEYIEIIDRGGMIRAYTRRYVSRRLGPDVELPPVLFVKTPMRPFCQ